jgi:hypothetical protein
MYSYIHTLSNQLHNKFVPRGRAETETPAVASKTKVDLLSSLLPKEGSGGAGESSDTKASEKKKKVSVEQQIEELETLRAQLSMRLEEVT